MKFLSGIFRYLFHKYLSACSILRVAKINLLYQGANIDFNTRIAGNCSIVCVKGGNLTISNCTINAGTHIFADTKSNLAIKDSFIGRNCVIVAKKNISIDANCLIAEMVVIRDQDHFMEPGRQNEFTTASISIEENVWLSAKVTILKGCTIGSHAVIAASAVVNKNVPANEVWGGVPAKYIKNVKIN